MKSYTIYRGVDNEIEFKGLRGKYFYFSIGGAIGTIILTFILYLLGLPIILVMIILALGLAAVYFLSYHYNGLYGRWGAEKLKVKQLQPKYIIRRDSYEKLIKPVGKNGKI